MMEDNVGKGACIGLSRGWERTAYERSLTLHSRLLGPAQSGFKLSAGKIGCG